MKRNNIYKLNILFALIVLSANITTAQTKTGYTLQQVIDYATKNATQIKNALIDIKLQQQQNKEITAAAFPQINANASLNNYLVIPTSLLPGEIAGQPVGTFIPVQFGTKYNSTGGLDIAQILFDGQVFVGLQARNAAMDLARKNTDVTTEQIKANVQKIYWQLVVGQKQLGSIQANIERFEKLLHDTKEIYKNGFAEKLDVDKVQVQLNNLKTEKEKIINLIDAGNAGLKFVINMLQKDTLVLSDTLSDEVVKQNILDESYNYNDRKEIQVLKTASKLNEFNVKRYQLSRIPTVLAIGSYSKNAQRKKFDFFGKGDWFTTSLVGIKINVPIFDGFARRAKIESAKLVLQKTNNTLENVKQLMDYEVANARTKIKSAIVTLDNQKQNIKLAESVYNTTKLKYEQGLGSNMEIYNAQTEYKVAENNYYSALYDAISAKIDYLKATGKL